MPTEPAIIASDLTKRLEEDEGVFDLDLEVERGRIVASIGPSGSGKTTTVRLMTGLVAPDRSLPVVKTLVPGTFGISGLHDVIFRGNQPGLSSSVPCWSMAWCWGRLPGVRTGRTCSRQAPHP